MEGKLRGVLIGCGHASRFHLSSWRLIEDVEIVAVASRDAEKARIRATEYDIPAWYTDYREMIDREKPDFVDIATPPVAHMEMVDEASKRKAHVLCQKPVAESLKELDRMISLTESRGVRFMVNENCRFQPWFRRIRELIDNGTLGKVFYASFVARHRGTLPKLQFGGQNQLFSEMEQFVLFELGVHYVDTLRYLLGEPESIYAVTDRVSDLVKGEDLAQVIVRTPEASGVIDLSWASLPVSAKKEVSWGEYRVEGTEGTAAVSRDGVLTVVTDTERWDESFPEHSETLGYRNALEHFVRGAREGFAFETSGVESRKTMEYVFAAYESSRTGKIWRAPEK